MDTRKYNLKNNIYIYISHYIYVNILNQKWEKAFSFPSGFPAGKRQNFKTSRAFGNAQLIGSGSRKKGFFFSFNCYSVLIPTWEHTGSQHGINAIPSQKCERLINTCVPQVADLGTRSRQSSQGLSLTPCPEGKGNAEVIPYKRQHWGAVGCKGEVPNRAVGAGIAPEQVLWDIIVKGHIQAKKW